MAGDVVILRGFWLKDTGHREPKIEADRKIELKFLRGERELNSTIFKSDEFGSFSGSFKIPDTIDGDIELKSDIWK